MRCFRHSTRILLTFSVDSMASQSSLVSEFSLRYEQLHKAFEDNFWATKMNLAGCSGKALTDTKVEYESWLSDINNLQRVRTEKQKPDLTDADKHVLNIMEKTFQCYLIEDRAAKALRDDTTRLETELEESRGNMDLGYTDPKTNQHVTKSSVQLRTLMSTNPEESVRKAAYEGLVSIGPFVAEKFVDIVKKRNQFAKSLGYVDFYDYKVTQAEGFNKERLFTILDDLEEQTRSLMQAARAALAKSKGEDALQAWNQSYAQAGEVAAKQDPYFPFSKAVDAWARTFGALGIKYKNATMNLDLLDRQGKYSNGFCHWPQPAWRKPDGTWVPSTTNFTSLATPGAVGSGKTALATLLHEGGHAAHFANIDQPSPFFSQERAPTSVAYAECQSMFLDSLIGDADWLVRYACAEDGTPMPWELVQEAVEATHAYKVFGLRAMIAVPYFEKALYELPEEEVTVERVLQLEKETEEKIQGGPCPRPLLSVPHILSDESACYYHGYVLATMGVFQTRAHFLNKYGSLADNPKIGPDLTNAYWRPGNSAQYLDLVERLTGAPLQAKPWVDVLRVSTADKIALEKKKYEAGLKAGPSIPPGQQPDLDMAIRLVHGDEVIATSTDGPWADSLKKFEAFCAKLAKS
eukprot:NODE_414_length_1972_cov_64.067751_g407_i0.p1 GENE.NODE_414_length_1972_cov_64.067751_g407_i0~~NODE_414_length_1972_cov_64.067751_g407_i0.p1  ORF type:complete len:644 (+),score=174.10 NODE_414_length_1972_cov_64.067751_g407_i0:29-1933(+)